MFDVRVIPNAARSAVAGERQGSWLVRLAAPPVDGKANDALISFLAEMLDVPRRTITIVRGQTSRRKQVRIDGLHVDDVTARMKGAA